MLNFGIKIILLLILVSGIIAYVGDLLGHMIGRKRITLFGLRPRYTAILFTVIAGIGIAFFTLVMVLAISRNAQTAFFGLEKLESDIAQQTRLQIQKSTELEKIKTELEEKIKQRNVIQEKLDRSSKEIAQLQSLKARLNQEISRTRQGTILYKIGEPVISATLAGGENAQNDLPALIALAEKSYAEWLPSQTASSEPRLTVDAQNFAKAVQVLQGMSEPVQVKLLSTRNVIFGEKIPVAIKFYRNTQIYKKGEMIASRTVNAGAVRSQIEEEIKSLLDEVHTRALAAGMQPSQGGEIGEISYEKIYDLSKTIKLYNGTVEIQALAEKTIYALEPLEIEFRLKYK